MIIDDVTVRISAGNGGDGTATFNKNLMELGPTGGTGGSGGSVYLESVADINALRQFRFKKSIQADNGKNGQGQFRNGTDAPDIVLRIPVGTVIHNLSNNSESDISHIGEKIILAKGGRGGRGNTHFKSATNTSPKQFEHGFPGQMFDIRFELKLIADVGLIGLPNVGKSNLLNELTNAKSKVADYPFTTLEPHLGTYYELVIADIPGLIEGASHGKGLGIKFLRHVERTKILFHLVSADSQNPVADYAAVRAELGTYDKTLLGKPEYVFLSKCDAVSQDEMLTKLALLKTLNKNSYPLSILKPETLENVKSILNIIKSNRLYHQ